LEILMLGLTRQAIRFGAVGVANTAVGLAAIVLLQTCTNVGPYWSNAGGYAAGLIVSYFANARWTFQAQNRSMAMFLRFFLAFVFSYGTNLIALHGAMSMGLPVLLAQMLGMATYSVLFFFVCRLIVFKPSRDKPGSASPEIS
jgi:putative flippase GtrA